MATTSRSATGDSRASEKAKTRLKSTGPKTPGRKRAKREATNAAIAKDLAPAVAIALLEKSELPPGSAPASMECLAAGASASQTDGKIRVQLIFENGAVLPVEMSAAAGAALSKGINEELPKT